MPRVERSATRGRRPSPNNSPPWRGAGASPAPLQFVGCVLAHHPHSPARPLSDRRLKIGRRRSVTTVKNTVAPGTSSRRYSDVMRSYRVGAASRTLHPFPPLARSAHRTLAARLSTTRRVRCADRPVHPARPEWSAERSLPDSLGCPSLTQGSRCSPWALFRHPLRGFIPSLRGFI